MRSRIRPAPGRTSFRPRWVTAVDVEALPQHLMAPQINGEAARQPLDARVLVRLHGAPLGIVECPLVGGGVSRSELQSAISRDLHQAYVDHLSRCNGVDACVDRAPPGGIWPSVSVVVCSHERPERLASCLASLLAADYPTLEVIVVDNAPRTSGVRQLVGSCNDARVRYVCEPIPGLSRSRNRGIGDATGEIVAFTDDDVEVDPHWIRELVRGFTRANDVELVTGLVLAANLTTHAQGIFERKVSWGANFTPQLFRWDRRSSDAVVKPFNCGMIGTGASFAVRRDMLLRIGSFDEDLGAGSPTRGGEDLDYFYRVLRSGSAIAYEPSSLVWHHHRQDMATLRGQMRGYGSGLTAFASKQLFTSGLWIDAWRDLPWALARLVVSGAASRTRRKLDDVGRPPRDLLMIELIGMTEGPYLYWRQRIGRRLRSRSRHEPTRA
jgi:GT2 family glycosyltransferase